MASDYYRVADWETRLRSLAHSVGVIVLAYLFGILCVSVALAVVNLSGSAVESVADLPPRQYAALNAVQFVGFFLAVLSYLRWRNGPDLFDVEPPSLRGLAWIAGGIVGIFALNIVLGVALQAVGADVATNRLIQDGNEDPVRYLYLVPVTLLFVAPSEELLFRGVVQGLFRRAYGVVPGVVFASVLFGFTHWLALVGTGGGKLSYVLVAAVLGLVLGALYELSENLLVPILVHGVYNTVLFLGQYFVATGAIQG